MLIFVIVVFWCKILVSEVINSWILKFSDFDPLYSWFNSFSFTSLDYHIAIVNIPSRKIVPTVNFSGYDIKFKNGVYNGTDIICIQNNNTCTIWVCYESAHGLMQLEIRPNVEESFYVVYREGTAQGTFQALISFNGNHFNKLREALEEIKN